VAYIRFLSTGVAPGQQLPGMGTGKMPELDRPARARRDGIRQRLRHVSRP